MIADFRATFAAAFAILAALSAGPRAARPTGACEAPSGELAPGAVARALSRDFSAAFEKVRPSVVAIESFSGWGRERKESGTGVLISAEGLVLTNAHVVDHAARLRVTLHDGRVYPAALSGADPKTDLAVLALKAEVAGPFQPIALGDSERARVGQLVMAVGNPYGLAQSATMGILSAKGRADIGLLDYEDFLQCDAEIHPGNSGGPLIDLEGRMLGLNSAVSRRRHGYGTVGFAIPTRLIRRVVADLIASGKVTRAWLGVRGGDLPRSRALELGCEGVRAILLERVEPGSPAERAGLRAGDVVTALDGRAIVSYRRFRIDIAANRPGVTVTLETLRAKAKRTVRAVLGELVEK